MTRAPQRLPRRDDGGDDTGFTLIEVMLAITIFGIVATAIYGTFSRTLASKAALPTVRVTFPLTSPPSPVAVAVHGFGAGSSAVP